MSFETPILIIAWRRPDLLSALLRALRASRPKFVFVACDGPRDGVESDSERVLATRSVIESEVNWDCNLQRLYSDVNFGCCLGPARAIDWFFSQVEEGIILEEDCIPSDEFLPFCAELLEYYRHDHRIWCIGGVNFQQGIRPGGASYYFSRYNHCWGWASWRRCWKHFDVEMKLWPDFKKSGLINSLFSDSRERRYWDRAWAQTFDKSVSVTWWDYQWAFACMVNNGLTVLPNVNLVSNVGFGPDATHTTIAPPTVRGAGSVSRADFRCLPLTHSRFVLPDADADSYTFRHHFKGTYTRRIVNRLIKLGRALGLKRVLPV
jgi:hypothetical protein